MTELPFQLMQQTTFSNQVEITQLRKLLLSDEGPPAKRLMEIMSPDFNISVGSVIPKGPMLINQSPTHKDRQPELDTSFDFEFEDNFEDRTTESFYETHR